MNLDEKIKLYKTLNHPLLSVSIFNQIFAIPSEQRKTQYSLIYENSEIKIDTNETISSNTHLGIINIKNTEFFTSLEIERQLDEIIKNIIASNIVSREDLQKQIYYLYNKEILNVILPPDSKEIKFQMVNRFYEELQVLIQYSSIKE